MEKEEIRQFIEDRIEELKEAYNNMPDYEKMACDYVVEELNDILRNFDN